MTGAEYRFAAVAAIGFIGLMMMCAAFILTALRGGWYRAILDPAREGLWPLQRRLMFAGAFLSVLFFALITLLTFIPGGIPRENEPTLAGEEQPVSPGTADPAR